MSRPLLRRLLRRCLLRSPQLFLRLWSPDDRELGLLGEEVAARHLAAHGWRILARRLRTRAGEADLVALRGGVLAVVEVKTGRAASCPRPRGAKLSEEVFLRWRPGVRCDARALARLLALGREIGADPAMDPRSRSSLPTSPRARSARARPRVDLVEVLLDEPRRRFRILHHEDLRAPLRRGP